LNQVKKKKRSSRVGFGRGDDADTDISEEDGNGPAHYPSDAVTLPPLETISETPDHDTIIDEVDSIAVEEKIISDEMSLADTTNEPSDTATQASSYQFQNEVEPVNYNSHDEKVLESTNITNSFEDPNSSIADSVAVDAIFVPPLPTKPPPPPPVLNQEEVSVVNIIAPEIISAINVCDTTKQQSISAAEDVDSLLNSSEDQLRVLDLTFQSLDICQRQAVEKVQQIQNTLKREAEFYESETVRLGELEAEQLRLAAVEEFEQADQLSADMDALRTQLAICAQKMAAVLKEKNTLESTFEQQFSERLRETAVAAQVLMEKKNRLQSESSHGRHESAEVIAIEQAQIAAEQQRLLLEMEQHMREEEAVAADLRITEEAISSQSGELKNKKADTEAALFAVKDEIK